MKRQANSKALRISLNASAFLVGIALVVLLVVLQAKTRDSTALVAQPAPQQAAATTIDGAYGGAVDLKWALVGVYTDVLPTPTPQPVGTPSPQMGGIDLGLFLTQSGSQVTGYVDLDSTMVYTAEHTIMATPTGFDPDSGAPTPVASELAVGPAVTGSFDGATLTLDSERWATTTASGVPLQRQFRLTGAPDPDNPYRFTGEYRETVWGFGAKPLTLIGRFVIVQPGHFEPTVAPTPTSTPSTLNQKSYLPLMQRQ